MLRGLRVVSLAIALAGAPFLQTGVHAGSIPAVSGYEIDCQGSLQSYPKEIRDRCTCNGRKVGAPVCDGGAGSSGSGRPAHNTSSSGTRSHKTSTESMVLQEMQKSIDRMFIADPAVLRQIQKTRMEGDRALQESQQYQQMTEEQRRQKAAQDAEAARLGQAQDLVGSLVGMPGSGDLLPGGTSFFGLGGGPGTAPLPDPWNDPMVVDLRHLRRASYMVQAVETATTEEVPALLENALAAVNGPVPDLPGGAVGPVVGEKDLQAFRKVYLEYAGTRAALARSEAALKEARRRKKEVGGPEADAAWEKARAAYDAAKERAYGAREEAVRVLRAVGAGKDPQAFRPPIPSLPALREETWVEMQKRMMAERVAIDALTKRTQKELLSVVPPLKGAFRKVHEGVVLGFGTDKNDADRMEKSGVSCFNGKSYASMIASAKQAGSEGKEGVGGAVVVSFGTDKGEKGEKTGFVYGVKESGRIVGDHLLNGAISLNTPQAREALAKISGKEFDRLVAHSNGATVTEALIREDRIRVNELDIVGGDMSLVKSGAYQELLDSGKVKRIVVWLHPYDPVPGVTSIAPSEMLKSGNSAVESLTRKIVGVPPAGVEYRYLPPDVAPRVAPKQEGFAGKVEEFFAPHFIESSYYPAIAKVFGVEYAPR